MTSVSVGRQRVSRFFLLALGLDISPCPLTLGTHSRFGIKPTFADLSGLDLGI